MKKILHVYPQLNIGGTEMVMLNIIRSLDKQKYSVDILVQKKGTFEDAFINEGVKIYYISKGSKYFKEVESFLNKKHYDIIHTHTSSEMGEILRISKRIKIPIRIAHSHNSRVDLNKIFYLYKIFRSHKIEKNANVFLACSLEAAKWLFPTKYRQAVILKNAVETEKFKFNIENRNIIRKNLNFSDDDFIVGMVSRISKEKNHIFIFNIIKDIIKQNTKIKFLIIGDGPQKENLEAIIKEQKLYDNVYMLGSKNEIEKYLSAMDLFILPSLFEGLGISVIEAQYNGLYSIVSTGVPESADIGENIFKRIPLEQKKWISEILNKSKENKKRKEIKSQKYNFSEIKNTIEEIYRK